MFTFCRVLVRTCLVPLVMAAYPASVWAALTVTSIKSGETIRYPIALLRGTAPGLTQVEAINKSNPRPDGRNSVPVAQGRYVILVELVPGRNRLVLSSGREKVRLTLKYHPMTTPYKVNVVWVTPKDGDTRYDTPRADDKQNYRDRLDTAAKIMQTFVAEVTNTKGFGRKTFNLEFDTDGKVVVHTAAYPMSAGQLWAKNGDQLYDMLYGWIGKQFPMNQNKNMVLMAFTRLVRETGEVKAHTALGGGGMGLFGSGDVFSWPESIRDVGRVFADATPVDPKNALDDSAGRSVIWGLASTTIGATLHEMGHTFGLPHANDPFCIMSRGFDYFNRFFCPYEPPSAGRKEPYDFKDSEVSHISDAFALQLAYDRWFLPDAANFKDAPPPTISVDRGKDEFVFAAPLGLGVWAAYNDEPEPGRKAMVHGSFGRESTTTARIARKSVWSELGGKGRLVLYAADKHGNAVSFTEADLRDPSDFLHEWHLSALPQPWTGMPVAPQLSTEQIGSLISVLRKQPLRNYTNGAPGRHFSFDLLDVYGHKENVVAYALATVQSEREKPAKLFAGGDDGFRIWLNGRLVVDASGVRADPPDSHSANVTLSAGENTLLVESTQAGGGWGFSVRLEEPVPTTAP